MYPLSRKKLVKRERTITPSKKKLVKLKCTLRPRSHAHIYLRK